MSARLFFPDERVVNDALTFMGRATRIGAGGVRLVADHGVLAMSTAVLAPSGLLDPTPTILAMRALRVDPDVRCDLTVTELYRTDDPNVLGLPDTAVSPAWAGVSAPREGWVSRQSIDSATLAARAQWGIAAVAHAVPDVAGDDVVRSVRAHVWGEPDDDLLGLPRGVSFAASSMGFIGGTEDAAVSVVDRWTRITFRRGYVLSRGPAVVGLTAVRRTGS